jgi:hypothetical protein
MKTRPAQVCENMLKPQHLVILVGEMGDQALPGVRVIIQTVDDLLHHRFGVFLDCMKIARLVGKQFARNLLDIRHRRLPLWLPVAAD